MNCILLHGLGQGPDSWGPAAAALGFSPLCPDLSRWRSQGECSFAGLYRGLEDYCQPLQGPLDLCGLSLGGILALQYAVQHPQRVRSLVLIGAQYTMPKGLLRFQNALFRLMPAAAFRGTGFSREDFISLSRSMMDLNFQPDLAGLRCQTLILCGERDRANRAAALSMEKQIPGARFSLIPGAGHEVNREAPEALARELSTFFQQLK